jgi:enoyl-CoA hydratase/carnithine racemase
MTSFASYRDQYETVKLTRERGILQVTFHTGGSYLQWGSVSHREWPSLFRNLDADPENEVVVMTGTGDYFTGPRKPLVGRRFDPHIWGPMLRYGTDIQMSLLDIRIPIISAINGPILHHAEIPLLSDIVLATPETVIQDTPHLEEGMVPGDGMHIAMPHLMGKTRASHFLFLGGELSADEAQRIGLINEIVSKSELLPRAYEIAAQLLRYPRLQREYTRVLLTQEVKRAFHDRLVTGLALEGLAAVALFPTEPHGPARIE